MGDKWESPTAMWGTWRKVFFLTRHTEYLLKIYKRIHRCFKVDPSMQCITYKWLSIGYQSAWMFIVVFSLAVDLVQLAVKKSDSSWKVSQSLGRGWGTKCSQNPGNALVFNPIIFFIIAISKLSLWSSWQSLFNSSQWYTSILGENSRAINLWSAKYTKVRMCGFQFKINIQ